MRIKLYYALGALCLLAAAFVLFARPGAPLFTSLDEAGRKDGAVLDSAYKVSFAFTEGAVKAPAFIPQYAEASIDTARGFAEAFGLGTFAYHEDDGAFTFADGGETLSVLKNESVLRYTNAGRGSADVPEEEAGKIAEAFVRARLPFGYQTKRAARDGGRFTFSYAAKLGPYTNDAFRTTVTVEGGAVTALEYYYYEYERLAYCGVMTMRRAFRELPVNEADGVVDLSRCSIVYVFENSILQPAYKFEGETAAGERREYLVAAGTYWE